MIPLKLVTQSAVRLTEGCSTVRAVKISCGVRFDEEQEAIDITSLDLQIDWRL